MASLLLLVLFLRHAGLLKEAGHFVPSRTSKMDFLFFLLFFFSFLFVSICDLLKLGKRHSCVTNVALI